MLAIAAIDALQRQDFKLGALDRKKPVRDRLAEKARVTLAWIRADDFDEVLVQSGLGYVDGRLARCSEH